MAKRRKKKTKKKSRLILKTLLLAGVASVFGLSALYFYISSQVTKALRNPRDSSLSAVYSAPFRLSSMDKLKRTALINLLEQRNYRSTAQIPKIPGEYFNSLDDIYIYSREFSLANGRYAEPALTRVSFNQDLMSRVSDSSGQPAILTLEPAQIASLSAGHFRASEYQSLSSIPAHVKNAVIAIEDERFYHHHGVDPEAIARAALANLRSLEIAQGGSTLTQQLAKNLLFSPKKTFGRKIMEMMAAFALEARLSKDRILEMYLNEIYLGQEGSFAIHGVTEASKAFFGKKTEELTIAEAALLAGIIRAPSYYSPRRHLERAQRRKELTLDKMYELNFISPAQLASAKKQKIEIINESRNKRAAPFFVTALELELSDHFNLEAAKQSGIKIYTGLSHEMQRCAEEVLTKGIEDLEKRYPRLKRQDSPLEGGLVAIEPQSGLIKAWAGGRDFSENQFNHVSQAVRQIGSTIKPFLYLTALDGSLNNYKVATVTSVLSDEPMAIDQVNQDTWVPENYDRTFHGDVTLRYALENSLNLPAVYIAQKVGLQNFRNTLLKFRISDNVLPVPALALGAADTTLLRLTGGYAALANGGLYVRPRLFVTAEDREGSILAESLITEEKVADEGPVFILTDILKGVIERGTARAARNLGFKAPAAGKTGTSNDTRDGWFVGFTPNLAVGVWIGFDDNKKLGLTGGTLAVPIWAKFMQCAADFRPALDFIPPSDIISVEIDARTLDRAGPGCPVSDVVKEIYVRGTEPRELCMRHNEYVASDADVEQALDDPENLRPRVRPRRKSFWERIFN